MTSKIAVILSVVLGIIVLGAFLPLGDFSETITGKIIERINDIVYQSTLKRQHTCTDVESPLDICD